MTIKASLVRRLEDWNGDARLYSLSDGRYVVVSGIDDSYGTIIQVCETYIFPSDSEGEVTDWCELPGSFKGKVCHEEAIKRAGWVL